MRTWISFFLLFPFALQAQTADCTFKPPSFTIHFGTGNVRDLNTEPPFGYRRVNTACPSDGHYTYVSATEDCFGGDWLTLAEDHTPGDAAGNMMLVNASWSGGNFLTTTVAGLKGGTVYEFGAWFMNVCKPSDKCPFPLLPVITIALQTPDGKTVASFVTGELIRRQTPQWTQYRGLFTTPASATTLTLIMSDESPGGCGNDFALDDITFRECVKQPLVVRTPPKTSVRVSHPPATAKPAVKKEQPAPISGPRTINPITKTPVTVSTPVLKQKVPLLSPPPPVLTVRENPLVKRFETEAGEIQLDLYDNGEIDGDTVSVYHNNVLLVARAGLARKPVSFRIAVDATHPHHELVMVAENLGSIPPNTSLLIVTTATQRYEVFISSSQQKNAKLIFDLKP